MLRLVARTFRECCINVVPPCPPGTGEESLFVGTDHGVQNRLQPAQGGAVGQDGLAQHTTIERAIDDGARERRRDGRQRPPTRRLQRMHCGICIKAGEMGTAEHRCCGGFAHPDAAGQADDLHDNGWTRPAPLLDGLLHLGVLARVFQPDIDQQ